MWDKCRLTCIDNNVGGAAIVAISYAATMLLCKYPSLLLRMNHTHIYDIGRLLTQWTKTSLPVEPVSVLTLREIMEENQKF